MFLKRIFALEVKQRGQNASFKNIKFLRCKYQTDDSSETHKHSIVLFTTKFSSTRQFTLVHVVVWWRMATKCTKIYNSRAHPLFCSLNLLLGFVLVAVVVVVSLSFLMKSPLFFLGVNNGDKSGKTPLHTAILSKQFRIVDRLLECGADVTIKDDAGDTALHTAIRVGSERLVLVSIS